MKGTKAQKGITLIALIITIVVLLILAVVAISSIKNDGILGHATNATEDYNQAVKNEQGTLMSYEDFLKYQSCSGHEYGDDGKCDKCEYEPCKGNKHQYVDGKCEICGTPEEETHTHNWDSETGKCTECDKPCEHDGNCEKCEICGKETGNTHKYDSETGKCTECEEPCKHDGSCITCGICGAATGIAHSYSSQTGACTNCGVGCSHDTSGSEQKYKNISDVELHEIYLTCQKCGYSVSNGTGEHEWNVDQCTKCLMPCSHPSKTSYDSSNDKYGNVTEYCDYCDADWIYSHEHDYNGGTSCKDCGYACTHEDYSENSYSSDTETGSYKKCDNCNYHFDQNFCVHYYGFDGTNFTWADVTCQGCGYKCTHSDGTKFTGNIEHCVTCGMIFFQG